MKRLRLALFAVTAMLCSYANHSGAQALNFGAYSYITLGDILTDNQSYTKEAWIRVYSYSTFQGNNIFSAWDHPFWLQNGVLSAANAYGTTSATTVQDTGIIPMNQWVHVAVTYDASSTTMKLYRNGVLIATNTQAPAYVASPLQIGAQNFGDFFAGNDMDEVRLWNVARTQSQIQANMNCDVAQQTGLIAYYRFNEGTPGGTNTGITSVYDYSGNANCGSFVNFNLTGTGSNYITGAISSCNTIAIVSSAPGSISGPSTVCAGATATLGNSVSGGLWSSDDIDTANISASGVISGFYAGTVDISYKTCGGVATKTITVNPSPVIAATAGLGSIVTAVTGGTSPYTYTWSNSSTASSLSSLVTGTYSVTVTDAKGCTATTSTYVTGSAITLTNSISISACNTVYTGGCNHNMYLGYGSQCETLTANPTGASSFTYSWSPSTYLNNTTSKSVTFTPTAAGVYTYTCTATNSGHSVAATVTICVSDAVDHSHSGKVYVCHYSCSGHTSGHTLSMNSSNVNSFLCSNHGDCLGSFGGSCNSSSRMENTTDVNGMVLVSEEPGINVFPNPFNNEVTIQVISNNTTDAISLTVYDLTGRVVTTKQNQDAGDNITLGKEIATGIYIVEVKKGDMSKMVKIVKN
jgi:Concanavalin A-like lectin/glucanases superfamily/Secretion system C-terminal sorting domain